MHKLAHIVIVFSLLMVVGQASASANYEPATGLYGNSVELSITALLTSTQGNCACPESDCSESDCTTDLMMDCAAAASARCASGMFGVLIFNQSPMALNLSGSIPLNYNVPIYQDISPGITPRPPKPVV